MRLLRAVVVLLLACGSVALVPTPAEALSCVHGWSAADARKMMATSASFFTGTVVQIDRTDRGFESVGRETSSPSDDVTNVVTFEVRSVWKGRDLHERVELGFAFLWADDIRVGRAYHVAVDERGVSGPCSFVPVANARAFHPREPRLPIEAQARATAAAPRATPADDVASDDGTALMPWVVGAGITAIAAAGLALAHRRRTSWN